MNTTYEELRKGIRNMGGCWIQSGIDCVGSEWKREAIPDGYRRYL